MTQTNTDYLLQVTTAVTDRTYGVPAANDAGKFDDHLTQAASFSDKDANNRSGSQRTESARYERDDRSWNDSGASKADKENTGSSKASQTSPTVQDEADDAVSGQTSSTEKPDGDEHETKDSENSTAAEMASSSQ